MSDGNEMASENSADEPTGRARGGKARDKALSSETKREIARKGALARWGPRATHRGNFQEEFGIDVDCYVLNDDQKTAVISQRGMGAALNLDTSGQAFIRLVSARWLSPYLGGEVEEKLANPLKFRWEPPGGEQPAVEVNGYDVTLLIDVCKAVVAAERDGKLQPRQERIARQSHIILNASAKAGIKGLVYALSGYDASREEVVAAFKFYVREEAREYEKEFPDQLYEQWYRLYQLPKPERNKPWKFKQLTVEHVYRPLAKSNGKILSLTREQRDSSDQRSKKLHQFLSEIGVKALRQHLGQLLGIAQVSRDRKQYERHIAEVFGGQLDLDF